MQNIIQIAMEALPSIRPYAGTLCQYTIGRVGLVTPEWCDSLNNTASQKKDKSPGEQVQFSADSIQKNDISTKALNISGDANATLKIS